MAYHDTTTQRPKAANQRLLCVLGVIWAAMSAVFALGWAVLGLFISFRNAGVPVSRADRAVGSSCRTAATVLAWSNAAHDRPARNPPP